MKKTIIFWVVIIFLIQSCDYEIPMKDIGSNYFIYNDSWGYDCIIEPKNGIIITTQVIGLNYDSIFIIAKQKPFNSFMDSLYNINPHRRPDETEKLYKKDQTYYYWIIDTREKMERYYDQINETGFYTKGVYGPYGYDKYWEKRREFNVPDSLLLRESEKCSFESPIEAKHYKKYYKARERIID